MILRLVPYNNTPVGFVIWEKAPNGVSVLDGNVATIFCPDSNGIGPTFIAEWVGESTKHGACIEMFVQDDQVRSLLDFAVRTNGKLIMAGCNADLLSFVELAWSARTLGSPVNLNVMYGEIYRLGVARGKQLADHGIQEHQFKTLRMATCQWYDGPVEFDGLADCWKDAVGEGYDGR